MQALVRADLEERERLGVQRYGTPLYAHNGRDALRDAYEEALDLACYLKQAILERPIVPANQPCSGCENLKFRLAMAESNNPDSVLSKHNAMMMAVANADHYKKEWEACHRQHEQCMKLLEKCSLRLSPGNLRDLVREMLSNGELPEGWDK